MYVHPYVDAYVKKGLFTSLYCKWRRRFGRSFKIVPDESLAYLQYRVVDAEKNELNLVDEKDNGKSSATKAAVKAKRVEEDEEPTSEKQEKVEKPEKPKETAKPKQPKQPKPKAPKPKKEEAPQPAAAPAPEAAPQTDPAHLLPVADEAVPEADSPQTEGEGAQAKKPRRRHHRRKPKSPADGAPETPESTSDDTKE